METWTVTLQEWQVSPEEYQIIDIRDALAFAYGHMPGAVNLPLEELRADPGRLPQGRKPLLCCKSGAVSGQLAWELREAGYPAYDLPGGYYGWLRQKLMQEENRAAEVEKSIRKKFHRQLWSKFAKAIQTYELVQPGDKIAVCISGGKDSMLMAKLFQELKLHNK
ncbi:MAG: ATPase, partial [Clostridiales bacterium]|nr:ATPase [Clostridiales bacterium]